MIKIPPTLRLIIGSMDRHVAWRLGASSGLAAASGLLAGLAPVALKGTVDAAITTIATPGKDSQSASFALSVALSAGVYLLCLCVGRLMAELRPGLSGAAEQRLYAALRLRFFRHVLDLPLAFHLGQRSGSLVHALQQAITGCQIALLSLANGIVPVLVEGLTVMAVLYSLRQPTLTTIFAATAAVYFAVMAWGAGGLGAAAHAVSESSAAATSILSDSLTNFEPIKSFGAEGRTVVSYAQALNVLEACWRGLRRQRLHTGLATTAIFALSMGAFLAVAIHAVGNGSLTVGGFVLANVYLVQMVRPLEMLATATRDLSQGLAFMGSLMAILDEPVESRPTRRCLTADHPHRDQHPFRTQRRSKPRSAQHDAPRAPSVSFKGVNLSYLAGKPVLEALSLEIAAGQSLAIVGASGCGKTSLVRLLLRLCTPQAGEILLDNVRVDALPLATLRSMIAVVPQDTVLFNSTIAANIAIGRDTATPATIENAARLAGLHDFVATLPDGYDTAIGERGLKLSGGERQRIAIARAVLREPLVYIFDEATSMLDGPTEAAILDKLRQISIGRTSIMIAHRLSTIRHADRIAVIAQGRVAEFGDHASLLIREGLYAALWRAQGSGGSV